MRRLLDGRGNKPQSRLRMKNSLRNWFFQNSLDMVTWQVLSGNLIFTGFGKFVPPVLTSLPTNH
jgi:hypothetical protein